MTRWCQLMPALWDLLDNEAKLDIFPVRLTREETG
jgi:hypothetical protein